MADDVIPFDTLVAMVKREDELRASNIAQNLYNKGDTLNDLDVATGWAQELVAKEFNISVDTYLKAIFPYRMEEEKRDRMAVASGASFIKYDKRRNGSLKIGDVAPDVAGLTVLETKQQASLLSFRVAQKPLVILAGSYT
eukprot:m.208725 g.208725  ORF g.208725 m.208725 type:complete len:140 (+) comp15810_c0_seq18:2960-3379(+)